MKHLTFVLGLAAATAPIAAHAQPAPAQAEALFRQARALLDAGKLAEACDAFAASQRAEPATTTLMNLANCRDKNGQLATAWGLFVEVARQTRAATDDDGRRLHDAAVAHAARIEPRLSTLTIAVPAARRIAGLEIDRDGERVEAGAWDAALPIDGGTYHVRARAPGRATWTGSVTVAAEHDAQKVELPELPVAEAPPVGDPIGDPVGAKVVAPPVVAPPVVASRSLVAPLALGGGAIVLVAGALWANHAGDDLYAQSQVEPSLSKQTDLWHSANARRYLAEGLGVAALGCAGAALYLYLRGGDEAVAEPGARGARVTPVASPTMTGIAVVGGW